ncbi:rod shape-determining protein RodA [Candidatus Fermentibacterales bacterium]|nr:rod shape-determining protein RodA [Candidatus Fermentibacterales bacterium]
MRAGSSLDRLVVASASLIVIIGLLTVYSAGRVVSGENIFLRQVVWLAVGSGLLVFTTRMDLRFLDEIAPWLYIASCLLLLVVLFFGTGPAGRWLHIGPLRFQPSEFAKAAMLLMAAHVLSSRRHPLQERLGRPGLFVWAIPAVVLTWLEPDVGTAAAMIFMLLLTFHWAGVGLSWIFLFISPLLAALCSMSTLLWICFAVVLALVLIYRRVSLPGWLTLFGLNALVGALSPVAWSLLKPYQKARLMTFLNPASDPHGAGWNVIQSRVAVGSGGSLGQGFLRGTQKELAFLPARHTDFVFSVWAEEFGFLGCFLLLAAYSVLVWRMLVIARRSASPFRSILTAGVAAYFAMQVFMNVGMTIGIMPVTGLPLLLVSYGGSHLIASLFLIGLVLNAGMTWREF